jgi:hypothetical protein
MRVNAFLIFIASIVVLTYACNQPSDSTTTEKEMAEDIDLTIDKNTENEIVEELGQGIPIYYNMYLTVELSTLLENEGAQYQESLLNPVEKAKEYITSSEKAMNLGVYAVDLSYARVFEQYQKAGSYFSAMYRLSEELGIPEDYIYSTSDRLERNISNKDSLNKIANEIYVTIDEYLKENEREHASALIVFGGWVEALYIAANVFDLNNENEDFEYMERIAEQKYSLEKLIELLEQFKYDETIAEMLTLLNELKPVFEKFQIRPDNIQQSVKELQAINEKINDIRRQIVT